MQLNQGQIIHCLRKETKHKTIVASVTTVTTSIVDAVVDVDYDREFCFDWRWLNLSGSQTRKRYRCDTF